MLGPDVTLIIIQVPAQTSTSCYIEAKEGHKRPDKYLDTEQLLGLGVGA